MDKHAFENALKVLRSIDMSELVDADVISSDDTSSWQSFRADPPNWLIRADDGTSAKLWALVERRAERSPERIAAAEAKAAALKAETRTAHPEEYARSGTREELQLSAAMLEKWAPDCFPASDNGQVHFARAMMEGAAETINAFLAKTTPMAVVADALDHFWNAALHATHGAQDATANAVMSGMVEGVSAVANRLREHAPGAPQTQDAEQSAAMRGTA